MFARALPLLLSGIVPMGSVAQYEPDTMPVLPRVCDVFFVGGGMMESTYAVGLDQWRQLAPNSELLDQDLSGYLYTDQYSESPPSAIGLSAALSIRLGDQARTSRSGAYVRGGFTYLSHTGTNMYLRKETRSPYDTLTSAQTGQVTIVDSLLTSRYILEHAYQELSLDAALIFLKEYPRHWSLYGGGGLQVGLSLNGRATITHSLERGTDPLIVQGSGSYGAERDIAFVTEEFATRSDLCIALYVPLGVSYRLGLKKAFWRAMNLTYEMRPSLAFGGVPELSTGARVGIGSFFGLRVDLVQ